MKHQKVVVAGADGNNGFNTLAALAAKLPNAVVVGLVPFENLLDKVRGQWRAHRERSPVHLNDPVFGADPEFGRGADVWINWKGMNLRSLEERDPGFSDRAREWGVGLRDMVLERNLPIAVEDIEAARRVAPDCIYLQQANPVDAIVYALARYGYAEPRKILSTGAMMEWYRFASLLTHYFPQISLSRATGIYIGGHGERAIPLLDRVLFGGVRPEEYVEEIDPEDGLRKLEEVRNQVNHEASWIREKTGMTPSQGPAQVTADIVDILLNPHKRTIVGVASYVEENEHYGIRQTALSLPTLLGSGGVERIMEIELKPATKKQLAEAVAAMQNANRMADEIMQQYA